MSIFINRRLFNFLLPALSGILSGIALLFFQNWLAWIMLIPLFYSLLKEPRKAFLKGAICGFIQGLILLLWMVSSVGHYTGQSSNIGFTLWLVSAAYFALVTAIPVWVFARLSKRNTQWKQAWWLNALLLAAIWTITDWARTILIPGIPWLNYVVAYIQTSWLVPLQIVSYTGVHGLTFLIITINVLLTYILIEKSYVKMWLPVSLFMLVLMVGYFRINATQYHHEKTVKVALLCENMDAKQRWMPDNGDSLANIFYKLNIQAAKTKPRLIVWSESALPWNLAMDDDLITQCLNITWPTRAGHIIGIFSPSDLTKGKRYNSAYYVEPDGAITGRYDKMQLLSFLEEPFAGAKLPFFKQSVHHDIIPGEKRSLLKTPYGKAAVLICNESLIAKPYRESVQKGADFFVVISNDAWFEGSSVAVHHFNGTRLRAVESGLDVIINSNRGISGIINGNGSIQVKDNSNKPVLVSGCIGTKKHKSFYAKHGDWFILLSAIYFLIFWTYLYTIKNKLT